MDTGSDNLDFSKLIVSRGCFENITPHKIAIVAFIREFGLLKVEAKSLSLVECIMAPKYRKDFCVLALKLIQCPDMEFKELEGFLINGKYNLLSVHLQNFCVCLQNIYTNGISALMDCVTSTIDKLMIEQTETSPCMITRNSVLGFYLRRMMLHLDKLTFVQLVALHKSFCLYYQKGRPGLMMRWLSKELPALQKEWPDEKKCQSNSSKLNNMETQNANTSESQAVPDETKQHELSAKMAFIERDHPFEEGQWSRKQAELFTATQANLLQINENKALPPQKLQKTIAEIMKDVPEYSDVHFLSFLNCIRSREFCGAQDSLYNCFDRSTDGSSSAASGDRNKHFRYAAINRAAMHTQFGHNEVAMESVREALVMSQEAGDSACLAHVAAWAARCSGAAGRALLPRTRGRRPPPIRAPRPTRAPPASYAVVIHLLAQRNAVNADKPAHVFSMITKGDSINYLHSMTDLTLASLSNTAALWSLYGKTEMASVYCQLLLNLNTKSACHVGGASWHWTEAVSAAAGGAAAAAAWRGDAPLLSAVHSHMRAPATHAHKARAQANLHAGKLEEAEQCILQLASHDRWESQLLKAEMYFLKGDPLSALESLHDILDYCKTEDDSLHFMSLRLRAMTLMSQVQHSFGGIHSMNNCNITLLNEVLSEAKKYHLHYIAATAEMHIANMQLHMGCVKSALGVVRKVLPVIMAHGGAFDTARALLLYTKCRVATAAAAGEARTHALQSCCAILDTVKKNFAKIGAQSRLLETWYLQAQLYNEMGNVAARNQCACMYRQLETQNPVEQSNAMVLLY